MGLLRNLEIMLGGIITRKVDSALFNWVEAVSQLLDGEQTNVITQTTWFIDPVNGSDAATGKTAVTALKTDAERQRRWHGPGWVATLLAPTTITYLSSLPSTDPVNFDVSLARGASLNILGTPTQTLAPTALTAVTTLNAATQTPWDVTAVGLDASHVGKIIQITAGARVGNFATVLKDMGAGQVRTSPFGKATVSVALDPWIQVTPQVGDNVQILTLTSLTVGSWKFRMLSGDYFSAVAPYTNLVYTDGLLLDGGPISFQGVINMEVGYMWMSRTILKDMGITTTGVIIQGGGSMQDLGIGVSNGFLYSAGAVAGFGALHFSSGYANGTNSFMSAGIQLTRDCIFQGAQVFIIGIVSGDRVSVFDQTTTDTAFQVMPNSTYISSQVWVADLLWGTANTGHGVTVRAGGQLFYVNKPTVNSALGAGRESKVGGTDKQWGAIPYAETATFNLAAIAVLA